jgi:LmbE family N-acetylglucosaminyl deacetylase
MENKTVLAIGAHPDDVEIFGAGTIALLKDRGWNVAIATMTAGDLGSAKLKRGEISEIRILESKNAAKLLNADYHCMENADVFLFYDRPTLLKAITLIRKVKPTIVFTMSPQDYMIDHEITSQIVRTACFSAGISLIKTDDTETFNQIPHLYYFDPMEGKDIFGNKAEASTIVDITSVMALKEEMLKCHESQRSWLKTQHGIDEFIIAMKNFSEVRGKEIGAKYAEGFRQHLGHAYPQDNILREELGRFVHEI